MSADGSALGFRGLYNLVANYTGDRLFRDVLQPALPRLEAAIEQLQPLRRLASAPPPGLRDDHKVEECFALSVVDDHLLSTDGLQPGEREAFFALLGFEPFDDQDAFSPFSCEIVAVVHDDDAASGIRLGPTHWSGLRFGEMMFARCGKTVRCHPSLGIVAGVADASVLHFTNRRRDRKVNDLSHGWGSNSRWSTDFHRNYRTGGLAFYNVDGRVDLAPPKARLHHPGEPPHKLDLDEARELLLHRGFVRTAKPGDHWPYDWRLAMRESGPAWPLDPAGLIPFHDALRIAGVS